MKKIIFILLLIVLVAGCDKGSPNDIVNTDGNYMITRDGGKFCRVDATKIEFTNETGFVYTDSWNFENPIKFINGSGSVTVHPESIVIICSDVNQTTGRCVNKKFTMSIGCHWCVKDGYDNGMNCLSEDMQRFIMRYEK